jgi:hypothetical protein
MQSRVKLENSILSYNEANQGTIYLQEDSIVETKN